MNLDSAPTLSESVGTTESRRASPAITILCHPDAERVGERCLITEPMALSRRQPEFFDPVGHHGLSRSLQDEHLSRRALHLDPTEDGGLRFDAHGVKTSLSLDGVPLQSEERLFLNAERLHRGAVLLLARRVVLLLHQLEPAAPAPPVGGLIGESSAMWHLRHEIRRVCDLPFPILVRGESGTGKELVARAIHDLGPRRRGPYLAINLAAIPATLAAAELFGAVKGAYSGADRRRAGFFERAAQGTLFLDEIGEAGAEIQVLLLRVLENGQIQPVGSDVPLDVDVRVLAATDADLESATESGEFRAPLLHRLANYEIRLPALRHRRDDFGRLFFHFLRQELMSLGRHELLIPRKSKPWFDAPLIAILAQYRWPGNVRQLRNVVRQLVVHSRDSSHMQAPPKVLELLDRAGDEIGSTNAQLSGSTTSDHIVRPARTFRDPGDLDRQAVEQALEAEGFEIQAAADRLRVSRPSLYNLMKRWRLPTAASLSRDQLTTALGEHDGDLTSLARGLKVSRHGLKQRLRKLGLI